jgi:hypothetical protein
MVFIAKYEGRRKNLRPFVLKAQPRHHHDSYERVESGHYELSILETCKQLYDEAHEYLWRNTTLLLRPGEKWVHMPYFRQVQHVQLSLNLGDRSELQMTQDTLQVLGQWAEKGNLRTISINIFLTEDMMDVPTDTQARRRAISELIEKYLVLLKDATRRPSRRHWSLRDVVRRVQITSGFMYRCSLGARPSDPAKLFKDIHTAFGGELWYCGILCWKDHELIAEPSTPTNTKPTNTASQLSLLQSLIDARNRQLLQPIKSSPQHSIASKNIPS